jgi:hypothetical protein
MTAANIHAVFAHSTGTFIFLLLGLGGIQASAIAAEDGSPGEYAMS